MKKIIAIFLALLMLVLPLAGCHKDEAPADNGDEIVTDGTDDEKQPEPELPGVDFLNEDLSEYVEVDEKYYLSEKCIQGFLKHNENHEAKGTGFLWKPRDLNSHASCLRANGALAPTDNTIVVKNIP